MRGDASQVNGYRGTQQELGLAKLSEMKRGDASEVDAHREGDSGGRARLACRGTVRL